MVYQYSSQRSWNYLQFKMSEENGYIKWSLDSGWDRPLVLMGNRDKYDAIDKNMYRAGLMCRLNGGEYVFIDTSNCWENLASSEAMTRILSVAGIDNVTVSQGKAMNSFNRYIRKRCNHNVAATVPTSVCIGIGRYEIEICDDGQTIKFHPCRSLLTGVDERAAQVVSTVCVLPIDFTIIPREYRFPGQGDVYRAMSLLFPDPRDHCTILWHIGNCIVDPVYRPRCMMLVGPGGSGKSYVLDTIESTLYGCSSVLPDGSLTDKSRNAGQNVAETVVSSRMVLCYDVDLENNTLNSSTFKNISGGDTMRVGSVSCKTNCSLTLATNGYINPRDDVVYSSDAIVRRVVQIPMRVEAITIPQAVKSDDNDLRLDYVCAAIHTRLQFSSMPVSPMVMLATLCSSLIDDALRLIERTDDSIAVSEYSGVLAVIAAVLDTDDQTISRRARYISPMATVDIHGTTYIRGFRTK